MEAPSAIVGHRGSGARGSELVAAIHGEQPPGQGDIGPTHSVHIGGVMPPATGGLTAQHFRHWSHLWWSEAVRAATEATTEDPDLTRAKEILFAVTFAEAFIFEWVRDMVLTDEHDRFEVLPEVSPPTTGAPPRSAGRRRPSSFREKA